MSNWVGGLPAEPESKEDKKKAKKGRSKPASPPDGAHPKTFYGGAIPPVPPNLPKYKKDEPPPKVYLERHCAYKCKTTKAINSLLSGSCHVADCVLCFVAN